MSSSSLIDPVVDHLADLALWETELATEPDGVDPLAVASSLLQRLRQVPDPRRSRGLRHPLPVILVLTACATLVAGNDGGTGNRQGAARSRTAAQSGWREGTAPLPASRAVWAGPPRSSSSGTPRT